MKSTIFNRVIGTIESPEAVVGKMQVIANEVHKREQRTQQYHDHYMSHEGGSVVVDELEVGKNISLSDGVRLVMTQPQTDENMRILWNSIHAYAVVSNTISTIRGDK